jgi:hypothetical protein
MNRAVTAFLNARDLYALSHVSVTTRARLTIDWDALCRARFPLYSRAIEESAELAMHANAPMYCARESLLLLEDRARDGHAATYGANSWITIEEFARNDSRVLFRVSDLGIIAGILHLPSECLILRGDIITDDTYSSFLIFDGVVAHYCIVDLDNEEPKIKLPTVIKLGHEFSIAYFVLALSHDFKKITYSLDTTSKQYRYVT